VYVAPPGLFAAGAADFEHFATGVRTESSPPVASETAASSSRDP
jgi:hypothetical protein